MMPAAVVSRTGAFSTPSAAFSTPSPMNAAKRVPVGDSPSQQSEAGGLGGAPIQDVATENTLRDLLAVSLRRMGASPQLRR